MKIKTLAATSAMAGALGFAAMGIGSGLAQADPHGGPNPHPPVPGNDVWLPGDPPGHNPFGPPGQVKNDPLVGVAPNPLYGVPPGHWDDPAYFGIPTVWLPPDIPGVTEPLRVVFNPAATAWGVWVDDGLFVPLPR